MKFLIDKPNCLK